MSQRPQREQAESTEPLPKDKSTAWDYFHVNSIDPDGSGRLLVSSRNMHTVYEIDASDGKILWRLGGIQAVVEIPVQAERVGEQERHEEGEDDAPGEPGPVRGDTVPCPNLLMRLSDRMRAHDSSLVPHIVTRREVRGIGQSRQGAADFHGGANEWHGAPRHAANIAFAARGETRRRPYAEGDPGVARGPNRATRAALT